ncbi:ImmA/IrrE family metallo-endopeptidase [Cupriavidus oxalaticus]|uniref:ImmA/IrrE family metallo-endopeptidase n=1 Tax=Cupriavidus oxalaticus TaxID=96344 RepID=A0A5P3VCL1_9BURK|nr:ImmA/IrrE family metallo-endopeptidase [Cupriavidus oxalaticus]QEZ44116.1 ImmA/IrrE family metallo-endopeptidase [Cupriavidus oxalaticus]
MMARDELLEAARSAAEVLEEFSAKDRINQGYTRVDPTLLASAAEVTVMYRPLKKLLGGFLREGGEAGILVNVDRPRGLVHMTCAHELGHYFLGHDSTTDDTVEIGMSAQLIERQANQFAYSLLAPRWLVIAIMRMKGWSKNHLENPSVVYQLSLRLGTSYEAMAWSLSRMEVISQASVQRLLANKPKALKLDALHIQDTSVKLTGDVWILDKSDKDRIIEPASTDRFVLDLPNHVGTGHLWTVDELRCEGFTLEPFVHDARTVSKRSDAPIVVGGLGSGTMRYELALTNGIVGAESAALQRADIAVHETAPWVKGGDTRDTLSFSAEFDDLNPNGGLSRAERQRRLENVRGQE